MTAWLCLDFLDNKSFSWLQAQSRFMQSFSCFQASSEPTRSGGVSDSKKRPSFEGHAPGLHEKLQPNRPGFLPVSHQKRTRQCREDDVIIHHHPKIQGLMP
jgi:hypothetical protein